ncbi:hypothetical protein P8452_09557 [Trifolium repens]|nr:hypothetical protein P8452_09557 [Trifolium repens]
MLKAVAAAVSRETSSAHSILISFEPFTLSSSSINHLCKIYQWTWVTTSLSNPPQRIQFSNPRFLILRFSNPRFLRLRFSNPPPCVAVRFSNPPFPTTLSSNAILKLPSLTLAFQTLILILKLSSIRVIDSRFLKVSHSVSGYIKGSFSVVATISLTVVREGVVQLGVVHKFFIVVFSFLIALVGNGTEKNFQEAVQLA